MDSNKIYLTPNEVADLLMVAPVTVRNWAQKGLLTAQITPGGHRRYLKTDVERFAYDNGINLAALYSKKTKILIVDDNRDFVAYLEALLGGSELGFEIETAFDGFQAGSKIHSFSPSVLLLDLMLPGLDGFRVCRQIKHDENTRHIRVIAMSGYLTNENRLRILEAGAETYFGKPIDDQKLLETLKLQPRLKRGHSRGASNRASSDTEKSI